MVAPVMFYFAPYRFVSEQKQSRIYGICEFEKGFDQHGTYLFSIVFIIPAGVCSGSVYLAQFARSKFL